MIALKPLVRNALAVALVAVALVAVALTIFSPTPPHAEAQSPPEPPRAEQFEIDVLEIYFADAATAADDEAVTITITPSDPNCWVQFTSIRRQINRTTISYQVSPNMAKRTTDGSAECSYVYTVPVNDDGPWARWERFTWDSGNQVEFTGSYTTTVTPADTRTQIVANYRRAAISRYEPQINISVPDETDPNDQSANRYETTAFEVMFSQVGETPEGCSPDETVPYNIGRSSNIAVAEFPPPVLIHDPDTTTEGPTCTYMVTFPEPFRVSFEAGDSRVLTNTGAQTTTINGPTPVDRFYEAQPPGTLFRPDISVRVPFLDPSSDASNRLEGATIGVTYTPIATPEQHERCTQLATETFTVTRDGSFSARGWANPSPVRRQLVDTPEGAPGPCRYTANFDDSFSHSYDGNNVGPYAISTGVNGDNQEVTATSSITVIYSNDSLIAPALSVTVPPTTDSGTGNNTYAGGRLRLDVMASGGPASGGPASGCTADPTVPRFVHHFVVQDNGDVDPETNTPLWVDLPGGTGPQGCVYTVTFPDQMTSATGVTPSWTLYRHGPATATVSSGSLAHGRSYEATEPPADTTFLPTVTLSVPQYDRDGAAGTSFYEGTTFEVRFTAKTGAGHPSRCSEGSTSGSPVVKNYVVGVTGTVAPDGGAPLLIDEPAGATGRCTYEVRIPAMKSSGANVTPAWTLRIDDTTIAEVHNADAAAGSATVMRRFAADAMTFAPTVAVTVPPIVGLTAGQNLFDGQTFDVVLSRASTPAQHEQCSLTNPETVTFTVDALGAVAGTPPATLVDRPMAQTARCAYDLAFPPSATSAAGAELAWTLTPRAARATLGGGPQAIVTGAYDTSVAVTYTPDVSIAVPPYNGDDDDSTPAKDESKQNAFTGAQLSAVFTSTASECVDASLTFTVQAGGAVTPDDPTATLVAYPAGATALCTYDVTFSPNEVNGTRLVRQSGATPTVSGVAQAASATYLAARTMFAPAVTVAVPFVDADNDEVNDLGGQSVVVVYERAASPAQHTDCSSGEADTFTVGPGGSTSAGGEVTPPSVRVSLVDRPMGVNERCTYTASAPVSITPPGGAAIEIAPSSVDQTIDAASDPITIRYGDVPAAQVPAPQMPPPPPPTTTPSGGGSTRRPATGGGSGGGRSGGGSSGSGSSGGDSSGGGATGPFVPSATQRVPVGVSLTLPADTFSAPTPIEVLINAPGDCGTDLRTFDGLAAEIGVTYAFDAAAGPTAEIIAAGARQLAQFAERGTQQRPCTLRVTLLSAPASCTLQAGADATAARTDSAGRTYVELAFRDGDTSLNLTPTLVCADPT